MPFNAAKPNGRRFHIPCLQHATPYQSDATRLTLSHCRYVAPDAFDSTRNEFVLTEGGFVLPDSGMYSCFVLQAASLLWTVASAVDVAPKPTIALGQPCGVAYSVGFSTLDVVGYGAGFSPLDVVGCGAGFSTFDAMGLLVFYWVDGVAAWQLGREADKAMQAVPVNWISRSHPAHHAPDEPRSAAIPTTVAVSCCYISRIRQGCMV